MRILIHYIGWPLIIGIVLGIITYFLPSFMEKPIEEIQVKLHIPIFDLTPDEDGCEVGGTQCKKSPNHQS